MLYAAVPSHIFILLELFVLSGGHWNEMNQKTHGQLFGLSLSASLSYVQV